MCFFSFFFTMVLHMLTNRRVDKLVSKVKIRAIVIPKIYPDFKNLIFVFETEPRESAQCRLPLEISQTSNFIRDASRNLTKSKIGQIPFLS